MRRPRSLRAWSALAAAAAVAVVAASCVLVLLDVVEQRRVTARNERLRATLAVVHDIETLSLRTQAGLRGYLLAGRPGYLEQWLQARRQLASAEQALLAAAAATGDGPAAQLLVARVRSFVADWQVPLVERFRRDPAAGIDLFRTGEGARRAAEIDRLLQPLAAGLEARREAARSEVTATTNRVAAVAIGLAAGTSAVVLLLVLLIWRGMISPVARLARAVRAAEDELVETGSIGDAQLPARGGGEVAALARAFASLTHRVQDEQSRVREARDMQEAILAACPLPVTTRDLDGRLTAFNPAAAEIFGWDGAVLGTRADDDPEVVDDLLARVAGGARAVEPAVFHRTDRDGRQRELLAHAAPLHDAAGGLVGAVIIAADVTEELLQRRRLNEAEELFERAFLNAPDGMGLVSNEPEPADRRWVKVNPALCRMLGYTEAELLAVAPADLLHPGDRESVLRDTARLTAGLQPRYAHVRRMLRKDGSHVWVAGNASTVRDEAGELRFIVVQYTDLTEMREATEALEASEHNYRILAETTSDVIVRSAVDGTRLYVSPAVRALLGYEPEEFAALSLDELVHPDDHPAVGQALERVAAAGKSTLEYRLRHKGGRWVWIEATVAGRHGADGELVERISVLRSIEERKRVEQEQRDLEASLHESQRLESLGVLAGGIAHDFNNLLAAVLLGSEMLRRKIDDVEQRAVLEKVTMAAERAAELSREMLAYSGKGSFVQAPVSLNDVVGDLTLLMRSAIPKKAELRTELDPALPLLLGDSAQLHQVVLNLITNAAEALEEGGGTITIRTGSLDADAAFLRRFELEPAAPGRYAFVEVADTGSGIDEAARARIFDPFFTTKFTGRGLGLAAVLGIVRGHAGGIRVESEPGRGTTITVILPADLGLRPAAGASAPASTAARTGALLLADDEEVVRTSLRLLLVDAGYTVVAVDDGDAAVEAFARDPGAFDAVILDLTMPGLAGDEAAAAIREIDPCIPVVVMSGFSSLVMGSRLVDGAGTVFLEKPFAFPHLLAALERVRDRRAPGDGMGGDGLEPPTPSV